MARDLIRNFSIIAHIDHGKSTIADRILEATGALQAREMQEQFLDRLDLERERGITIKAQTVRLKYKAQDNNTYEFNLIDTPGHVDFHYEVSRSLAACEGALLVVDAVQGVEAQTLTNVYVAMDNGLEIVPVINKIDLPNANPDEIKAEIEDIIGIDARDSILVSAKTGQGIKDLLEAIVQRVPPPTRGALSNPLRALVYDSWFDPYLGAVVQIRVIDGKLKAGQKIQLLSTGSVYEVYKLGVYSPHPCEIEELSSGEVGYFSASIKNLSDVHIGDTVADTASTKIVALPGFKKVKPMVFGGLFPVNADDYQNLRAALEKLSLNDSSFSFEPETSTALGFGFRCGYLGLLHMEIIQERLEREFGLALITTAPSVVYRVALKNQTVVDVENPNSLPPIGDIDRIEEPVVTATIHTPQDYVGSVLKLCEEKRGIQKSMTFHSGMRAVIIYELPLNEIVLDFHDRLKSSSKGYASFDYELTGYKPADLVKLDIRLNNEPVDALSFIVHRDKAYSKGNDLTRKLKELMDRQMYDVAIQAAIGTKVIARSTVKALRKNVTAKCYGGDITRKRKLLEKQKAGKKRMKQVGSVAISQEAFLAILKLEE
ncbi:MAG: elongation factor 4 [SAR324 cluster bacterium]|uniref:Elongation factor 4 n=1 Tax=SAR324 cluster bacterium TaxID=2024889 RepID=A0A7X9FTW3_9DELT|nr:elongation factor 4 [SAR324 cluster bacterium]